MAQPRLFVQSNFSLELRSELRGASAASAQSDFLLIGRRTAGEPAIECCLLANPHQSLEPDSLSGFERNRGEWLVVRLAPELLVEAATRLHLARAGFELRFRRPLVPIIDDARLRALLMEIAAELETGQAGWREMIAASINQLAVHLLRAQVNVQRSDEVELSRVGVVDRRLRRAIEFMHDNCARELKLAEMARAAYLSEFHFARLFKKITGTTPHTYLAGLRVERARRLLAETDLALSEVGARVGYSSQSHFTRVFREATGLTPKAFRAAITQPPPE